MSALIALAIAAPILAVSWLARRGRAAARLGARLCARMHDLERGGRDV